MNPQHRRESRAQGVSGVKLRFDGIRKSENDQRLYRGLALMNGMKVLLVSDVDTATSAAALIVKIGHHSDPDDLPGLAHFCEHMLFMGSEKHRAENSYSKYLSELEGVANAVTDSDSTCFSFDVQPEFLAGALDRFSQYFHHPLFIEDVAAREVNAVNDEHEAHMQDDVWRVDQVCKSTSKPGHVYRKFGTGNKETLSVKPEEKGINVRDKVIKFHAKWYSSNIMSLVVLGKDTLDELESLVVRFFHHVIDKAVEPPSWPDHPYGPEQLQLKCLVVPLGNVKEICLMFPIPDLREHYKANPGYYVGHLLHHEGPGSLFAALRARNWSNNLSAGVDSTSRGFGFFRIAINLTEVGAEHADDIVKLFFQYIDMLRRVQPQKWIYLECQEVNSIDFRFKENEDPIDHVTSMAHNIHRYPIEEVMCGEYLIDEWKPDLINMVLDLLTADNMRIIQVDQKFNPIAELTEEWYGTKYHLESVPAETIANWKQVDSSEEFKLPEKNQFIPTDVSLIPKANITLPYPAIIKETPLSNVWFKQDDVFLLPKADIMFYFYIPLTYQNPLNCSMTTIFVDLFKDSMNENVYAAQLAGLTWEFENDQYGLELNIRGYNSKQQILLDMVMKKLTRFKVEPPRFDIVKENYIRGLRNMETDEPYKQAGYYLNALLTEKQWTRDELLASVQHLTLEQIVEFIPLIFKKMHFDSLIHGNVDKDTALLLVKLVEDKLVKKMEVSPIEPQECSRHKELCLADRSNSIYRVRNSIHKSSCLEIYYQCGLQSTQSNMLLQLLVHIMDEPYGNTFRTQEQLGNHLSCSVRESNSVQGLRLTIQSESNPTFLDTRVEAFLAGMEEYIINLSDKRFTREKKALARMRLEIPESLSVLSTWFWSEVTSQHNNFDRKNIETAYLRTITKQNLLDFFNEFIHVNGPHRRKLAVHVISTAEGVEATETPTTGAVPPPSLIQDISSFKKRHEMYPLVQPYKH